MAGSAAPAVGDESVDAFIDTLIDEVKREPFAEPVG